MVLGEEYVKTGWAVAFAVTLAFLGAGLLFLITTQPKGEPVKLAPPPTPAPLLIHVSGAVASPGVYPLPNGARLKDALAAAGGLLPDADAGLINLAAFLEDGQQVWVPWKQDVSDSDQRRGGIPIQPEEKPSESPPFPVRLLDINIATQSELESLPGIGPKIALHY